MAAPQRRDRIRPTHASAALSLALFSSPGWAHSFGRTYTLPVPIWLYLYGAAAALVVSFVLVGYFVNAKSMEANRREHGPGKTWKPGRYLIGILRPLSVGALALAIIAGFLGTDNPYRNINMTLFWVVFCLGFTYLTALAGDWFAVLNPYRALADGIERLAPGVFAGRYRYPAALEYWPALLLYMAFIWIELFGRTTPFSLAAILSAYTALNLLGSWLIGKTDWFERCEFFGVFLRLVARIAPVRCESRHGSAVAAVSLRQPFIGLIQERTVPFSLLLFVLFMLSSTAFDGLKETALWVGTFWTNLYQHALIPLGNASQVSYATIRQIFLAYQSAALILSPLLYFLVYALFLSVAKLITRTRLPLRTMLLSFSFCLIPIAFVYHFTHYYTLLQVQGAQMLWLISDPLGLGCNLLGTQRIAINVIPDMAVVWHVQVLCIVAGHVVSVCLAHLQALKLFPDRRTAILSQLPTLLLMVAFTSFGLWILSLPLDTGMRNPMVSG